MGDLDALAAAVRAPRELTSDEVEAAAAALAGEGTADEAKAGFLSALSAKGETAGEIAAFARAFRRWTRDPGLSAWSSRAIDIVGTGGDHAGGFNVSSLVTLVVACAGVPVMKHGNRGITSKCGSADLFAGLGFSLEASAEQLQGAMAELGYVFFFAPAWQPAFARIGPVRRLLAARGERSVFNVLGPLLNPGRPDHILLGAATAGLAERLGGALEGLGTGAGLAVHGVLGPDRGIDELTTATTNLVRGVGRLRALRAEWSPADFGLAASPFADIAGGDLATNLALAERLVNGGGPRGLADTIALNSAVALWITGARPEPHSAVGEARDLLLGGAVRQKIADTRDFFSP